MIIVIAGQAGSGKSTLRKLLLERLPSFSKAASFTTRLPRKGETDKIDYFFVSKKEFLENRNLVLKREENNNLYGVDKRSFQNNNLVMILDLEGIKEIKDIVPAHEVKIIYLSVPQNVLVDRLSQRQLGMDLIYKRFEKDKDLNEESLRKICEGISMIVLDNTQSIDDSLNQTIQFIASRRIVTQKILPQQQRIFQRE